MHPKLFKLILLNSAVLCLLLVGGCSENAMMTETSSDSFNDLDSQGAAATAPSDTRQLINHITTGTRRVVLALNQTYYQGTLPVEQLACINNSGVYPLTDYYCGDQAISEPLEAFGYPVRSLRVKNSTSCLDALVVAENVDVCEVEALEVGFPDDWTVSYRQREENERLVEQLTLTNGLVPFFVDPEFFTDHCRLVLIDGQLQDADDQAICDLTIDEVLTLSNPDRY